MPRGICSKKTKKQKRKVIVNTNINTGLSLFRSQGSYNAMVKFTQLVSKINQSGVHLLDPKEKVIMLSEVLSILADSGVIQNMNIRSVDEIFQSRWCDRSDPSPKNVVEFDTTFNTVRIIELYSPPIDSENIASSTWYEGVGSGRTEERHDHNIYSDLRGKLFFLIARKKFNGISKEKTHKVEIISESTESTKAFSKMRHLIAEQPILFDKCMCQLIKLAQHAIHQAQERMQVATDCLGKLLTVTESIRDIDLHTMIHRVNEKLAQHSSQSEKITMFRKIVEMCGPDGETRYNKLSLEMKAFGMKDLTQISGLSLDVTMKIINDWPLEEK